MPSRELFLSYNSRDKRLASSIKRNLKAHGFRAFLAHQDIEVTKKWREEIQKHLDSCSALIAIVTRHFDESKWTNQEVGIAIGKGKPVASLIFDNCGLPGFLEAMQGVKVADNELDKSITRVARVVIRLLGSSSRYAEETVGYGNEYIQFSNKPRHLRNDTLSVLPKLGFRYSRDMTIEISSYWTVSRTYRPHVVSAIKRIWLQSLGFSRTYRFLIDFLDEWSSQGRYWNPYAKLLCKLDSDEYHSSKYNNVWLELSYGKFRESSLRTQASQIGGSRVWPTGYTIIPITSSLNYIGPDRTACNFDLLGERALSKLRHVRSLAMNRRLSRGALLNSISAMTSKPRGRKNEALQHEMEVLREAFGFSEFENLRADPGFVAHGMKSSHHVESAIQTMLDWIKNNGHWL